MRCVYFAIICKLMRETLILYICVCKYLNNLCKHTRKTGMLLLEWGWLGDNRNKKTYFLMYTCFYLLNFIPGICIT